MPYITRQNRVVLEKRLKPILEITHDLYPGELNYVLTRIVATFTGHPSYSSIVHVVGVLENVKQEYYRRVAVPYEIRKRLENGDVYGVRSN